MWYLSIIEWIFGQFFNKKVIWSRNVHGDHHRYCEQRIMLSQNKLLSAVFISSSVGCGCSEQRNTIFFYHQKQYLKIPIEHRNMNKSGGYILFIGSALCSELQVVVDELCIKKTSECDFYVSQNKYCNINVSNRLSCVFFFVWFNIRILDFFFFFLSFFLLFFFAVFAGCIVGIISMNV